MESRASRPCTPTHHQWNNNTPSVEQQHTISTTPENAIATHHKDILCNPDRRYPGIPCVTLAGDIPWDTLCHPGIPCVTPGYPVSPWPEIPCVNLGYPVSPWGTLCHPGRRYPGIPCVTLAGDTLGNTVTPGDTRYHPGIHYVTLGYTATLGYTLTPGDTLCHPGIPSVAQGYSMSPWDTLGYAGRERE